jgi:hypothetical protein
MSFLFLRSQSAKQKRLGNKVQLCRRQKSISDATTQLVKTNETDWLNRATIGLVGLMRSDAQSKHSS